MLVKIITVVKVYDRAALWNEAFAYLVSEGHKAPFELIGPCGDGDTKGCLRILLGRSENLNGTALLYFPYPQTRIEMR